MRFMIFGMVCLMLAALGPSAFAFEEQQAAPAAQPSAKETPKIPAESAVEGQLTTPDTISDAAGKGTEVRIPGLGKLGVLPKMDFGLELLYGAAELEDQKLRDDPKAVEDDDLRIRGTIKHRF